MLHTPRYTDSDTSHQFRAVSGSKTDATVNNSEDNRRLEPEVYLYNRPHSSGGKGLSLAFNYAIATAALGDWFKNFAPVYQQMKRKTKTSIRYFSRALSELHETAMNLDWFIELFAPAVIGRRNYFGICFTTLD